MSRETVFAMTGLAIASTDFHVTCDRCRGGIYTGEEGFHCLQCPDFDVCEDCAAEGLYCSNDTHEWSKFHIKYGYQSRIYTGPKLMASGGTILQPLSKRYPSVFRPRSENDTPQSLFSTWHRYINKHNHRQMLIYTDGACSLNGQNDPQGGSAFVYRKSTYNQDGKIEFSGTIHFALENVGPTGEYYKHTSNRAELRAVIAALQFKDWSEDCNRAWRSIVIATDSEYVALNATATERVQQWEESNWRLANGSQAKNLDLWLLLLQIIRIYQKRGLNVSFWRIPREWNERADEFAKLGATTLESNESFQKIISVGATSHRFTDYEYDEDAVNI